MIGDITWKANGIDLDTALGAFLTDATVVRPDVTTRRTEIEIPGAHGMLSPGLPVYGMPQVLIGPKWLATSQSQLEERVNHARALFGQPTLLLGRVSGGLETSAVAKLVSISAGEFLVGQYESCTAILNVPGVFFRSASWTSSDFTLGDLLNEELTGLSGSTGPIGDVVVRVTGPATSVTVTDPGTGTGLSWTGSLAVGQYLFMSARPLSARVSSNASDWLAGGTDQSPLIAFPAAGRLQLWPVVQSPTVRKVLVNATGTGRGVGTRIAFRGQGSYL